MTDILLFAYFLHTCTTEIKKIIKKKKNTTTEQHYFSSRDFLPLINRKSTIEGNWCNTQEMFLFMVKSEVLAACWLSEKTFRAIFKSPSQHLGCEATDENNRGERMCKYSGTRYLDRA